VMNPYESPVAVEDGSQKGVHPLLLLLRVVAIPLLVVIYFATAIFLLLCWMSDKAFNAVARSVGFDPTFWPLPGADSEECYQRCHRRIMNMWDSVFELRPTQSELSK